MAGAGGSGVCHSLTNDAPQIIETRIAEAPPTFGSGGLISDGTYYQTGAVAYTGPGGLVGPTNNTFQETVIISAATATSAVFETVRLVSGTELRETYDLALSGSSLTFRRSCPPSIEMGTFPYSVSGRDLTIYNPRDSRNQTFTKQ